MTDFNGRKILISNVQAKPVWWIRQKAVYEVNKRIPLGVGGLSGILSGSLFFSAALVLYYTPALLTDTKEELLRFLARGRAEFVAGYALLFLGATLAMPLIGVLYWLLRDKSRVYALVGAVSGLMALNLFALGVTLYVGSTLSMADLFAMAPPADVRFVVLMAEALGERGLIGGIAPLALVFVTVSFLSFGLAIHFGDALRKPYGWIALLIGVLIPADLLLILVTLWPVVALLVIVWLWLVGLRLFRLSAAKQ